MPMNEEFAEYVDVLMQCSEETHRAEDRSPYVHLIADAGAILADMVMNKDKKHISKVIKAHDRLWGHTWLQDPVYEKASRTYEAFKCKYGFGI
jgi:hypothetical protein